MTTLTVYPNEDGYINVQGGPANLDGSSAGSVADGSTGANFSVDTSSTSFSVGQSYANFSGDYYFFREGFLSFDTSSIPDAAIISAASLALVYTGGGYDSGFSPAQTAEIRWRAYSGTIDSTDWVARSSLGGVSLAGSFAVTYADSVGTLPKTYTTSLSTPTNVSVTGNTRLLLNTDQFRTANYPPNANGYMNQMLSFYSSEQTGTSQDPALTVTYTQPPGAPTVTYPNGGETLSGTHTVTWTAATDPDTSTGSLQYEGQFSNNSGSSWSTLFSLTSAGATSQSVSFSALGAGANCLVRVRAYDGANYGPYDSSNAVFTNNATPTAPTPVTPSASQIVATGSAVTFGWTFNDPNSGDTQGAYALRRKRMP